MFIFLQIFTHYSPFYQIQNKVKKMQKNEAKKTENRK